MAAEEVLALAFAGGIVGVLIVFAILFIIGILIGLYVYFSLAWYIIAKKLKYRNTWLAWIPVLKNAMILQLGTFHWAWIFLLFIPFFGWIALIVITIIAKWRVFEKRKYPGWFVLSALIPQIGLVLYAIALGFVAWQDRKGRITI